MKLRTWLLGAVATTALAPAAFADRGSDGEVKILYWQAPSILNPYLSGGTKDLESASLILEPLARYNQDGTLTPWLVDEVPTVANGGVSEDLTTITWKLSEGLLWSDGTPLTSADVKFTYEYCTDPDGGCASAALFDGVVSVETPDDLTIVITFGAPTPVPYGPFVGQEAPILQAAQFADCLGAAASSCTAQNYGPIGTGPFVADDFKPNDVIVYSANPNYRDPAKPAFAKVTFKGGGDAAAAGRAVMETGEYDYAWNLQLAPDVIAEMAEGGKGTPVRAFASSLEKIYLNFTNPDASLSPEERAVIRPHPFLQDPAVVKALTMAIDKPLLVEVGYGDSGTVTCSYVPAPAVYTVDIEDCLTQDLEGAKALLDAAGIVDTDGDGVREKDGVPLKVLYQTSTNAVRQDFQALIKDWWESIGLEVELRNISASVFFGGDAGSPDTYQKFYADIEMYTSSFSGTDPQSYLGEQTCDKAPSPSSQWQGSNTSRFCDEEYDALYAELTSTADFEKRVELVQKMNVILYEKGMMIPLVHRGDTSAYSNTLGGVVMNSWDSELWNIADWYRID